MSLYHSLYMEEPLACGYSSGEYVITRSPHIRMSADTKYYIHPDSVGLLEPTLYDDYDMGGDGGIVHIVTLEEMATIERDIPSIQNQYTTLESLCGAETSECLNHDWKVLRRNGQQFFWPESEGV